MKEDNRDKQPLPHSAGFSQLINHGIPNRSTTLPNRSAQKVSARGICTVPSSASALKMRSASVAVLGLNITQKLCGFLYSPGMASQPSNTPSPEASPPCRIFLVHPGGVWPAIGEPSHVIMKVILPPRHFS